MTTNIDIQPDIKVSIKQTFGIDSDMEVDAFSKKNEYVPEIDKNYKFDKDTTLAIISGFAFNKNWNYFAGMNDQQVINFLKSDMIWHKPTQSFSSSDNFFKVLWNNTLKDELDLNNLKSDYNHMRQFKFDHKDIKAFSILGISVGLRWQKIQEKFKILVKKFHPDMNSGNKKFEEKLKLITLAYTQLKNTYREKIDT